jgi:hypothetical protein
MFSLLNNICLPIIYFVHSSVCFIVCFLHFLKISIIFFYRWDFWFAGAYLWAQFIPTYLRLFVRLFVRSFVRSFVHIKYNQHFGLRYQGTHTTTKLHALYTCNHSSRKRNRNRMPQLLRGLLLLFWW